MAKYVSDTAAGRSISAWVIMRGSRQVAIVRAHYGSSRVLVNITQDDKAAERSEKAAARDGVKFKAVQDWGSPMGFQQGEASGYGYDKFASAMRGLYIDGHRMCDHSSRYGAPKPPKGRKLFPTDYQPPKGYSLANYIGKEIGVGFSGERSPNPRYEGEEGYSDCYRRENLKYLEANGYRVIQAI